MFILNLYYFLVTRADFKTKCCIYGDSTKHPQPTKWHCRKWRYRQDTANIYEEEFTLTLRISKELMGWLWRHLDLPEFPQQVQQYSTIVSSILSSMFAWRAEKIRLCFFVYDPEFWRDHWIDTQFWIDTLYLHHVLTLLCLSASHTSDL